MSIVRAGAGRRCASTMARLGLTPVIVASLASAGCAPAEAQTMPAVSPAGVSPAGAPQTASEARAQAGAAPAPFGGEDQISHIITHANARATKECWLPSQERGPSSSLAVAARLAVAPDGRVNDVLIEGLPPRYPELKWCIGNVLWQLKFGKSSTPMFITVSLALVAP